MLIIHLAPAGESGLLFPRKDIETPDKHTYFFFLNIIAMEHEEYRIMDLAVNYDSYEEEVMCNLSAKY